MGVIDVDEVEATADGDHALIKTARTSFLQGGCDFLLLETSKVRAVQN